jgi:hypothetical protein
MQTVAATQRGRDGLTMGVVLIDLADVERRFGAIAAAEEADEGRRELIDAPKPWTPQWGSKRWAEQRYGAAFLAAYRWLSPAAFCSEVLGA